MDIQELNYSIAASNVIIQFLLPLLPLLPLLVKTIDYFFSWKYLTYLATAKFSIQKAQALLPELFSRLN
ncbi:MAG: hypothetical protein RMX97_24130 [Nostoc sp. DedQUE11]|nr:hypothetical protein [Nostoc sp. DedQUE11]